MLIGHRTSAPVPRRQSGNHDAIPLWHFAPRRGEMLRADNPGSIPIAIAMIINFK